MIFFYKIAGTHSQSVADNFNAENLERLSINYSKTFTRHKVMRSESLWSTKASVIDQTSVIDQIVYGRPYTSTRQTCTDPKTLSGKRSI